MTLKTKIIACVAIIAVFVGVLIVQHIIYMHMLDSAQAETAATTKQLTVTADQLAAANVAASRQQEQQMRKTADTAVRQEVHDEAAASDLVDFLNASTGNR